MEKAQGKCLRNTLSECFMFGRAMEICHSLLLAFSFYICFCSVSPHTSMPVLK